MKKKQILTAFFGLLMLGLVLISCENDAKPSEKKITFVVENFHTSPITRFIFYAVSETFDFDNLNIAAYNGEHENGQASGAKQNFSFELQRDGVANPTFEIYAEGLTGGYHSQQVMGDFLEGKSYSVQLISNYFNPEASPYISVNPLD